MLHRLWHSPRTGPVILFVVGLPLLLAALLLVIFPVLVAVELVKAAIQQGYIAFARSSAWYLWYGCLGWAAILVLGGQLWRIQRANRGLTATFDVALASGVRSAYRIAARLGKAMGEAGCDPSEVIKEDYGAGIWLRAGEDRYWLAVSTEDDSDEAAITLAYDPALDLKRRLTRRADRAAFAKLEQALRAAIAADTALALQQGEARVQEA